MALGSLFFHVEFFPDQQMAHFLPSFQKEITGYKTFHKVDISGLYKRYYWRQKIAGIELAYL